MRIFAAMNELTTRFRNAVQAFLERIGTAPARLGTDALGDPSFVHRLPRGRRRSSLLAFWNAVRDRFLGRTFSFDPLAAQAYGDMAAAAERAGARLNVADGQIAAIAKVHRMTIATRDASDFEASGVPLVNPWEA